MFNIDNTTQNIEKIKIKKIKLKRKKKRENNNVIPVSKKKI